MSIDKRIAARRDEELRHKEEAKALEEANLDGADEVYDEPDRFAHTYSDEEVQSDIQPAETQEIDNDLERTLF